MRTPDEYDQLYYQLKVYPKILEHLNQMMDECEKFNIDPIVYRNGFLESLTIRGKAQLHYEKLVSLAERLTVERNAARVNQIVRQIRDYYLDNDIQKFYNI